MAARSRLRFVLGLAILDALIVATFGLPALRARAPARPATAPGATAVPDATRPLAWGSVDPEALGRQVGALYLAARRATGKARRVILAPPRRVNDDVELRASLATRADGRASGYPPSMYCFRCAPQRCLFHEATLEALEALGAAFRPDGLRALATTAGAERVLVTYVGSASAGPVVRKEEVQLCAGGVATADVRYPADYDTYDEADCGAHACELLGSGETVELASGPIDDNRKLACARAACLRDAAGWDHAGVPARVAGELSFEAGGVHRGAQVIVTLRGIAAPAHREAYARFWATLDTTLRQGATP